MHPILTRPSFRDLRKKDSTYTETNEDWGQLFNDYFGSVFTKEHPVASPSLLSRPIVQINVEINDVDFHVQDVTDTLGNLSIQ